MQGITKPAFRRLACQRSVKPVSELLYEETRGVLKVLLKNVTRDAVKHIEHAKLKAVSAMDVVHAFKCQGHSFYSSEVSSVRRAGSLHFVSGQAFIIHLPSMCNSFLYCKATVRIST
jgi:histone H3/H4